eukprot:606368-Rhodomonas_salina.1
MSLKNRKGQAETRNSYPVGHGVVPGYPGTGMSAYCGQKIDSVFLHAQLFEAFVQVHSLPAVVGKSYHKLYREIT